MHMTTSEIATVLAWIDALNDRDLDTLDKLSSGDIEIGDANGATQGRNALRAWATDLDEKAAVGRLFVHDGVVVAERVIPEGVNGRHEPMFDAHRIMQNFRQRGEAIGGAGTNGNHLMLGG